VVDELPAWLDARLPLIAREIDKARERPNDQAVRDAERG
jgi:hypothetical protein